jgi:hypothetical protein
MALCRADRYGKRSISRFLSRRDSQAVNETKRFQDRPEIALAALTNERFTMADLCSGKSIRAFVQRIFRYSRSIGQDSTFKNLIHAWNALDPQIQLHIKCPTPQTTEGGGYITLSTGLLGLASASPHLPRTRYIVALG